MNTPHFTDEQRCYFIYQIIIYFIIGLRILLYSYFTNIKSANV